MAYPAGKIVDSSPLLWRWKLRWKGFDASSAERSAGPVFLILVLLMSGASRAETQTGIFSDPLPTRYRTQGRFTAALNRSISATWKGVPLRSMLRRLAREREIAILLDRRVDPDQEIEIDTGERSLRSAVDEIARLAHLAVSRVGNSLLVGPPAASFRLRTLVALRERELAIRDIDSSDRLFRLRTERATIRWDDLERPSDIVRMIGRQFRLSIAGIELIPHDLWAGAVAPEATAAEALSLVLNQFDLTFEWTDRGAGIRLIAVPPTVAIERSYALHGRPAGETLRTLHSKIEGLEAEVRGGKLLVRGSLEQHEAVASVLGLSKDPKRTMGKRPTTPLERQSFTLQAHGVSLRDLLDELKKQGLTIEYNADELQKAGIDLKQKVSCDLPQLPAPQFFSRLLDPYGLTFRFDHAAVVIRPK
ncbi:MAG TPA: STN domain-containing protein [Planctomycetaceae bacterium]|jgi:hypothetical protein|nr:STN domain-containing protein [Planctomycetaceae bacterium]